MILQNLVRQNILNLKPYSSARSEFKGNASVFLDANENPLNTSYNRYPDPLQWDLKRKVAKIKGIAPEKIFLGNGSDEPIDLVVRIFCEPGRDNIVAIEPTYGMYRVCADINNVEYRTALLRDGYALDAAELLEVTDKNTKLAFLCSPNNPTANLLKRSEILKVIQNFDGIVILDEAYIDFSIKDSLLPELDNYPNLLILQTFSKAWGLAAVRLGMAFASPEIIALFNKVKYPYNINQLTQEFVLSEIDKTAQKGEWVKKLLEQRDRLIERLNEIRLIEKIYRSDANFVLVKVADPNEIYSRLVDAGIIVRNRHSVSLCAGCLRITVGAEDENNQLLKALKQLSDQ
jgi:histidinol-phosphate aminotransferase